MGEYAASSLEIERLLRASHIKPWRDADNHERVDIFNGLIRGPAYDAAFYAGLITFDAGGAIAISPRLISSQCSVAGIEAGVTLKTLTEKHHAYLSYHRDNVFEAD